MNRDPHEIDPILAVLFPHIKNPLILLRRFDEIIGVFESFNGGSIEITTRLHLGDPMWNEIDIHCRQLMREEKRANK